MNPRINEALAGLPQDAVTKISQAVLNRLKVAQRLGTENNQTFIERCYVEYAEEARAGRLLDESISPRETVLFTRDYRGLYTSPKPGL